MERSVFLAALYAWGRTLVHHPHLHCAIPGGGITKDGSGWVACRPGFVLPVRVLSRYFRRVLLAALQDAFESGQSHFAGRLQPLADFRRFAEHLRPDRQTDTRRLAISNQRLCSLDDGAVRFRHADYRSSGASRHKTMTLAAAEFSRRMLFTCSRPASTASATMAPSPLAPARGSCPSAGGRSARRHHQRRSRTPRLLTIRIAMRS